MYYINVMRVLYKCYACIIYVIYVLYRCYKLINEFINKCILYALF